MNVHLVDGTFELFRAYYGSPPSTDSNGKEVGAARGLARSLLALLGESDVTHVAIAFDHVIESFRNRLYPGYKTGEGMDPALYGQFGLAEDACRALGIVTWPMIEFECDDALATAAARFAAEPRVERVVICSPDKDLAPALCRRRARRLCFDRMPAQAARTSAAVVEKFGVLPQSMPAPSGWRSSATWRDGYPGYPRWGAKIRGCRARRYERIEAIPDLTPAGSWRVPVRGAAALAASLAAQRRTRSCSGSSPRLCRTDVPLTESLDDLRWRGPDGAALRVLAHVWDDTVIVERAERLRQR